MAKQTNLLDQQSGLAAANSAPAAQGPPAPVAEPGVASAKRTQPRRRPRTPGNLPDELRAMWDVEWLFQDYPKALHAAMIDYAVRHYGKPQTKEVATA